MAALKFAASVRHQSEGGDQHKDSLAILDERVQIAVHCLGSFVTLNAHANPAEKDICIESAVWPSPHEHD